MVAVAGRQVQAVHHLADVGRHLAHGAAIGVGIECHFAVEVAAVDLVGAGRFHHLRHLAQPYHAGGAIGTCADSERQALQVLRVVAGFGGQAHVHVVGLVVRGAPVAHGLPCHQNAQRTAQLGGAQAEVGGRSVVDLDRDGGFVGAHAGIQIDQTGNGAQLVHGGQGQALQFALVRSQNGKLDLLVAAHRVQRACVRDDDAGHALQALTQLGRHLVHAAAALLAVHQAHINAGVVFAQRVAGVDGGDGVAHLRKLAQDALDLTRLGFSGFERGAHGRLEGDVGFGEVGLGHELGAHKAHHENAQQKDAHGQQDRLALVHQRPGQDALVGVGQAVGGGLEPGGHTAQGPVVQGDRCRVFAMRMDGRVMPDAREHRVEREAHEHRNHDCRHDGDAELVKELADDALHETDGQEHRHDGQGGGQHRQTDLLCAVE